MSLFFEEHEMKGELWQFSFKLEINGKRVPVVINYRMTEEKAKASFDQMHQGIVYTHRLISVEEQKAIINGNKKSILDAVKVN
jgi:hypothetical protein